jgi:hypothetical protein
VVLVKTVSFFCITALCGRLNLCHVANIRGFYGDEFQARKYRRVPEMLAAKTKVRTIESALAQADDRIRSAYLHFVAAFQTDGASVKRPASDIRDPASNVRLGHTEATDTYRLLIELNGD